MSYLSDWIRSGQWDGPKYRTTGPSRLDTMRNAFNYLIHDLNSSELASVSGSYPGITLFVGGLAISVRDLANAGWTCRIVHNRHGGRSRISFYSTDRRSTITFRTPGSVRHLSDYALFDWLSDELNGGTWTNGIFTVNAKPIPAQQTDEELLCQVTDRINRRLAAHRMAHPPKVNRSVIERAIAAVA